MLHFIPNLTMLFQELPFIDRFAAAKALGFSAVEFLFPYQYKQKLLKSKIEQLELQVILFDFPAGNWQAGHRGLLCDPDRTEEFRRSVDQAVSWACVLKTKRLNCLAGLRLPQHHYEEQWETCLKNLQYAAPILKERGLWLLIEPINAYDMPDYFIHSIHDGLRLIEEAGCDNIYLQFDIYHAQRTHGEITNLLLQHLPRIAHIQIADSPGRHEPGTGELRFDYLWQRLREAGYAQYIGMEYIPSGPTYQSFQWLDSSLHH